MPQQPENAEHTHSTRSITCRCPNCGGIVEYSIDEHETRCQHCDALFEPEKFPYELPVQQTDSKASGRTSPQPAGTVEEFLEQAPWNSSFSDARQSALYSCPSCGAKVVAFRSVVSATCPYCTNNLFLSGDVGLDEVPSVVVPFELTEEQVKEKLAEHFKGRWYLDRKTPFELAHIQAVYVPYYVSDIEVKGTGFYIVRGTVDGKTGRDTYVLGISHAEAKLRDVSCDGSSRMPDAYMEGILPFYMKKAEEFSTAYIAGQMAEVPDISEGQCRETMEARARRAVEEKLYDVISDYEESNRQFYKPARCYVECEMPQPVLGALPIWLAHYRHGDDDVLVAVNGQTGKAASELPRDDRKRVITLAFLYTLVGICAIAGAFFWMFFILLYPFLVLGVPAALAWAVHCFDRRWNDELSTARTVSKDEVSAGLEGWKTEKASQSGFKSSQAAMAAISAHKR